MEIQVKAGSPYPIYIEEGALSQAGELFELNRKALIVTDNGVPKSYAETVAAACKERCDHSQSKDESQNFLH